MCVDFTDLNKACPKDSFPLPRIDQLVDSTAGHKLLTFMDASLLNLVVISARIEYLQKKKRWKRGAETQD